MLKQTQIFMAFVVQVAEGIYTIILKIKKCQKSYFIKKVMKIMLFILFFKLQKLGFQNSIFSVFFGTFLQFCPFAQKSYENKRFCPFLKLEFLRFEK